MRNGQVMEVCMALVARMTQELVMSVGADGRDARGQFAMWIWPTAGKLVWMVAGEPLGIAFVHPRSNVANSRAIRVGMCVSGYLDFYLRRPSPENS